MTWAVVRVRLAVSHLPRARGPGCSCGCRCGCGWDPVVAVAASLLPPVPVVMMSPAVRGLGVRS
jgi:hypothetical protein